jgi:hypothetical protein
MSDHIFIATPCYGGLVTQTYMQSVIGCMSEAGAFDFRMTLSMLGNDALITRCRNTLVHQFMTRSDASHLLFVDADIGFTAADIASLLRAEKPVIGALYPLREHFWDEVTTDLIYAGETPGTACLRYVGESDVMRATPPYQDGGLLRVAYAGTGFLMIARAAIANLITAYPQTRYRRIDAPLQPPGPDAPHALFDCMIDPASGTYLSEDFAFCQRFRDIGGEIWIDRSIRLSHTGPAAFTGNPMVRPPRQEIPR